MICIIFACDFFVVHQFCIFSFSRGLLLSQEICPIYCRENAIDRMGTISSCIYRKVKKDLIHVGIRPIAFQD